MDAQLGRMASGCASLKRAVQAADVVAQRAQAMARQASAELDAVRRAEHAGRSAAGGGSGSGSSDGQLDVLTDLGQTFTASTPAPSAGRPASAGTGSGKKNKRKNSKKKKNRRRGA